jgi:hypothetical protein
VRVFDCGGERGAEGRGAYDDEGAGVVWAEVLHAAALSVFLARRFLRDARDLGEVFVVQFEVEQGVDMGRPSRILTEVWLDSGTGEVRKVVLGGSAVKVMEGFLDV